MTQGRRYVVHGPGFTFFPELILRVKKGDFRLWSLVADQRVFGHLQVFII